MSGNAALAAAKRRRNPLDGQFSNQQLSQKKNVSINTEANGLKNYRENNSITPSKLILEHDLKIFYLERKVENLIENSNENSEANLDLQTLEMLETNSHEVKSLKSTILKQQKSIQELNSLVTNLKASIISQNNNIDSLTEKLDNLNSNDLSSIKEEVKEEVKEEIKEEINNQEINTDGIMKLDINES